jgi:hypothetical protein
MELTKREEEHILYEREINNKIIITIAPLIIGTFIGILILGIILLSQTTKGTEIAERLSLIFMASGISSTFILLAIKIFKTYKVIRDFRNKINNTKAT